MMVSKIAVMALVAIVAAPIILGYAFNLTETTRTDYKTAGDSVNVTPLLENGIGYSYAHANTYQINSEFYQGTYFALTDNQRMYPVFSAGTSEQKTALRLYERTWTNQSWNNATQNVNYNYFYQQFDYNPTSNHHTATIYETVGGVDSVVVNITDVQSFYYEKATGFYQYSRYSSATDTSISSGTNTNISKMVLNTTLGKANVYQARDYATQYADYSKGYQFKGSVPSWYVNLPENTKSVLYTLDLNSISDANYKFEISKPLSLIFEKTTTNGVVSWKLKEWNSYGIQTVANLYYDPTRSDNTYQVKIDLEDKGISGDRRYYSAHSEIRYVGGWPALMGEANYYLKYDFDHDYDVASNTEQTIDYLWFHKVNRAGEPDITYTPRMRVDDAFFRAFTYNTITNNTYNPATFKDNPATTFEDVTQYGSSIVFGGNTYNVSKEGKITLEGRDIPVKGLVFMSVPNGGRYDNKIGNTLISTSATPSTITFNGVWAANISTKSMESYTITETEWIPGEFAWDGIDTNFILVGMMAALAALVGFGIYAKNHHIPLIPLVVVCCGATLMFLMMI